MNSGLFKNSIVYVLILLAVIALIFSIFSNPGETNEVDITTIAEQIKSGNVAKISVDDGDITVVYNQSNQNVTSRKEGGVSIFNTFEKLGVSKEEFGKVEIEIIPPSVWGGWGTLAITILPLIIFGGLLFFMVRQAQGSNNQALSFGKSRARMFSGDKPTVTFDDVAGAEEAKQELFEVVEFLREPEKFISLGARIPKGVLMVGPPGCGKTLMAKAVSGEAGVPFFSISGSEFVEMFVGVGASRVRDLFDQAKRNSPCIVFVDEIDAVGRHRGAGLGGSHDEREQTLNQILVEMDGFETDTNIIIMAATNRPDILDPALLRPGRFDRRVILDRPDWQGRKQILEVHVKGKPLATEINMEALAKVTIGFSGADLENVVNEGAILAARADQKQITMTNLNEAVEKIRLGPERRSLIRSEEELKIIAYHEAGHAVVAHMIPEADPVHKVTIISRGPALGVTYFLPEDDQTLISESAFKAKMAISLGGRAAEEIIFPYVTTGASGDFQSVTQLARSMVTQYGMSKKLGPMTFGDRDELIFLGRQISEQRNYSEETAEQIDAEVRRLADEAHERALTILRDNIDKLELIANSLLEHETLDAQEFAALMAGDNVVLSGGKDGASSSGTSSQEGVESTSSDEDSPRMVPPSTAPLPA